MKCASIAKEEKSENVQITTANYLASMNADKYHFKEFFVTKLGFADTFSSWVVCGYEGRPYTRDINALETVLRTHQTASLMFAKDDLIESQKSIYDRIKISLKTGMLITALNYPISILSARHVGMNVKPSFKSAFKSFILNSAQTFGYINSDSISLALYPHINHDNTLASTLYNHFSRIEANFGAFLVRAPIEKLIADVPIQESLRRFTSSIPREIITFAAFKELSKFDKFFGSSQGLLM